ncbi:SH3 domain-containing protein [Bartonella acomydis]|uniref:SH3b domain-containing protein n=1 Tax=Bartonella acomydis TaxID=686234 RepID=A0ABP9MS81_9HYPH
MFKKSFLSTTVILFALGGGKLGMTAAYAGDVTVAHVASDQTVLRTGPADTYKVIATVPKGEKVQIHGCLSNKAWCSLRYNGKVGWVFAGYLNVNNVPEISFTAMRAKPNSKMKAKKQHVKQIISNFKNLTVPHKTRKKTPKFYRTDMIIDATGVKTRDERTIFNPSPKAQNVSVKHVNAYNPFFPDDVNFKNFERNETRYRIVTYPAP